jgi:hypothetical protein
VPFRFGQKKEHPNVIEVTLVDAMSGLPFATTNIPVEQLPETFELDTTMNVGSDDWSVEKAEPIDRAGYLETGRLTLVLRKVERIDPKRILYSLPTTEDALPPMGDPGSSPAYGMHEDDWRQREFVARQFAGEVESEFGEIRKMWAEQDGPGFKRIHVRSRVREPLLGIGLTLEEVSEALGGIDPVGLTLGGDLVVEGFAFLLPGGAAYGRVADGSVEALGLGGDAEPGGLRGLANERGLVLIDWIRASSS